MGNPQQGVIDEFTGWLSDEQKAWFRAQPRQAQERMAGQLAGSFKTASDIVEENGGPQSSGNQLPSME
ncbi:hypothetical protein ACIQF6_33655 [Kitasatospora sp. NPDC092948]|uniref:hypothetical protein n=1 Tax=Kitasatospora sp. NPDC092948 TaxID=3364088 RepID=UPI00380994F3